MEHRWAVESATGAFLYGGAEPYDCAAGLATGQIRVALPRLPNPQTEKYSGDPVNPIAVKSAGEIAATATAQQDAAAAGQFDGNKMLVAKGLSDLAWRLGKAPGALTPAEIAAERARILAIYKSLP